MTYKVFLFVAISRNPYDEKRQRLKKFAAAKNISVNKLMDELVDVDLNEVTICLTRNPDYI